MSELTKVTHIPAIPKPSANELALAAHADDLIGQINRAILTTAEDTAHMTDLLKIAKMKLDQMEAERKSLVEPLNGVVKAINERFKAVTKPLTDAIADGKAKMLLLISDSKAHGDYATASTRKTLSYEVTNFDSVPSQFKLINDKLVMEHLKAGGKIRGIRIIENESVVIR